MAASRTHSSAVDGRPRLRRGYFDSRFGQLHVHYAIPSGGGFDERTTLVCLHPDAGTGHYFDAVMPELGRERSVYAPDLPGRGESDGPPGATLPDHAQAVLDFAAEMRFRQVDLLACGDAAAIATEIARTRPDLVRRVVPVAAEQPGGLGANAAEGIIAKLG